MHFVLSAAVGTKTKHPKRDRSQKEVEFVSTKAPAIDCIGNRSDVPLARPNGRTMSSGEGRDRGLSSARKCLSL